MRFLLLILLIASVPALAQQDHDQLCKTVASVPLPPEAEIPKPSIFPACESYKSYAGIGRPVDYVAARNCAWKERTAQLASLRQNPNAPIAWVVGGSVILANIYSNGNATLQNLPLAMRMVCEQKDGFLDDALADLKARAVTGAKISGPFDLCEYAATTFEMNFCTAHTSQIEDDKHTRAFGRLSTNWTQAQKSAFAEAQKAFEDYVTTVGRRETYLGGTIRNIRVDGVEQELKQAFFDELLKFEHGDLPRGSPQDYQHADSDLNTVYRKALDAAKSPAEPSDDGEIKPGGIRDTERSWLHYRDSWIAFARLRYPSTSQDTWSQWLTATRTERLKLVLCGFNSKDSLCTPEILKSLDGEL